MSKKQSKQVLTEDEILRTWHLEKMSFKTRATIVNKLKGYTDESLLIITRAYLKPFTAYVKYHKHFSFILPIFIIDTCPEKLLHLILDALLSEGLVINKLGNWEYTPEDNV